MKNLFLLFALLFIGLFIFVLHRGYHALSLFSCWKYIFLTVFISSFGMLIASFFINNYLSPFVGQIYHTLVFTFLLVFIYLALWFLAIDILKLINHYFLNYKLLKTPEFNFYSMLIGLFLITTVLSIGNYQFHHPKIVKINLTSNKTLQGKKLKIVAASDLHLGHAIDKKKLKKYVELINSEQADIVLLLGDIADREISPLIEQNMHEEFLKIQSTYGVYGISGNHEYYASSPEENFSYYEKSGINMLFDEAILIEDSFYLIGRDDFSNENRKSLNDIMIGLDIDKPTVVMDHQPFSIDEAVNKKIDLQLSGHTHNGQFFPGNLIVKFMYELSYGYMKKEGTSFYVSSGLGIWGPHYRIGTISEIVVIDFNY